jgi:ATF/CREB family transcription factor
MLTGPTGTQDYFDPSFSRGFPTPNESGLRTGLTPGGGGSMFPAPSPNSQALFNSLQSGGATPSTLDFYRTSVGAKAASQSNSYNGPTSQPTDPQLQSTMDRSQPSAQPDPFGQQHADADAVNGLYMLAQANSNGIRNNQFSVPNQQMQTSMSMQPGSSAANTSPVTRRGAKNSIGSNDTNEMSDAEESEPSKPATRSRGKKAATSKSTTANNRRKAEDTPAKTPANKRSKANSGAIQEVEKSDDEDMSPHAETSNKKMTDEEKRKNFLERNRYASHPLFVDIALLTCDRVAALKCRQRKKQWLANLQAKVELFSTENDTLSQTVTQLREELVNLKTLLLAHKDCPVSVQQGIAGPAMAMYLGADSGNHHANPYGIGMQPNGLPQGMQMSMGQQTGPGAGQGASRG